ncbi:hypothetical protein I588_00616 [Enterococcus pallens ATCC BAA-351]|uniref:BioF2-like acetyltransferase domain-containing protein n=1 Tax=Enterococcus pallens ATCC BAA-351 TaxID=1158607 RepID=R2T0K1_9ENTE|nr:hypothetical protein UAU_02485 [Enterococcus pallens ATCC BAA-351]EOU24629.1 hypothetical protein I588_00616 [Enterococcus pallens ATCC BAA-351]OJG79549.1 hypothetical protein RV10_GL000676 [Enterococcus pallens]
MSVKIIKEKEAWNQVVYSFRQWDAAHEWGYFSAFHVRDPHNEPLLFFYESSSGRVAYPFLRGRLDESTEDYQLQAVYGYTGPLIEGTSNEEEIWKEFTEAFANYCRNTKVSKVEERFHPLLANDYPLFKETNKRKVRDVVLIETAPESILEESYSRKDKRRGMKRARKNGIEVFTEGIEHLERFLELYYQTMDHNQAAEIYYFERDFFLTLAEEFQERLVLFNAYLENQIIESALYLYTPLCAYSFLTARDLAYSSYHANNLVSQKAYAFFYKKGIQRVNEGGGRTSDPEDSLFRFKQGFTKKNSTVPEIFPYYQATTRL